jgi:hypothetical protein
MELDYRNKRNKLSIDCKPMAPNIALKINFGASCASIVRRGESDRCYPQLFDAWEIAPLFVQHSKLAARARSGLNNERQIHGGEHPFVNSREKIDAIPTLEGA